MADGDPIEEPPPVGGSWRRLYWIVILSLALSVVALVALELAYPGATR